MDTDEKVRRNVVETTVAIASHFPAAISDTLVEKLRDRTRDKKHILREFALKQCCSLWIVVQEYERWSWIVNDLLKYYAEKSEHDHK
jgi:hypothetical protein